MIGRELLPAIAVSGLALAFLACGGSTTGNTTQCSDGGSCPTGQVCNAQGFCESASGGSGGVGGGGFGGAGGSGFGGVGGNVGGGSGFGGGGGSGTVDPVEPGTQPPADPNLPPSPSAQLHMLAFKRLLLGETNRQGVEDPQAWKTYGYNLDGIVSTKTGTNHCKGVVGTVKSSIQTDGPGGIDNSFGANLMPIFGALADSPSQQATETILNGSYTVLLRMTEYNGGVDDSGIQAALYQGAPRGSPPFWNGSDSWPVTAESVNGASVNQPKIVIGQSYVSGGVFVASPSIGALPLLIDLGGIPLTLPIHSAILSMDISGTGSSVSGTNGTIAGILDTEQLIFELKKIIGAFDPSLCNSGTFDSIAQQIRQASDIMTDGTNGNPSVTCNGISIGIGFDAAAVVLGGVAPPEQPPPDPCAGG